jgi:Na+-driven multidrug efflux pump
MFGAALATSISYFMCFFVLWFFIKRIKTESKTFYITPTHNKEITALSFVTFSRQGVVVF